MMWSLILSMLVEFCHLKIFISGKVIRKSMTKILYCLKELKLYCSYYILLMQTVALGIIVQFQMCNYCNNQIEIM